MIDRWSQTGPRRTRLARTGPRATALLGAVALATTLGVRTEAATLHVPGGYPTIGAALAAASPGDEILVAPGTYSASTNGEAFPVSINTAGVQLLGSGADVTTIDAELAGLQVVRATATGSPRVSGFTITGGLAPNGGGVFIDAGDLELDHNVIIENRSSLRGAGVFIRGTAAPSIHHNVIWANVDSDTSDDQDPHGVVFQNSTGGTFEHNLIGRTDGNGLLTDGTSTPLVRNNIFFENGVPGSPPSGRGICWFSSADLTVNHNIFYGNFAAAILWLSAGGNLTATAANAVDGSDFVFGNLDDDPLLVDPDQSDFALSSASPAIDGGDPTAPLDPDGTPADIGPFYFDQSTTSTPGPIADIAARITTRPNPFRDRTVLSWAAPRGGSTVEVLDVQGRRVRLLRSTSVTDGRASAEWDGRSGAGRPVPPGIYFLRPTDGESEITAKVLRLR